MKQTGNGKALRDIVSTSSHANVGFVFVGCGLPQRMDCFHTLQATAPKWYFPATTPQFSRLTASPKKHRICDCASQRIIVWAVRCACPASSWKRCRHRRPPRPSLPVHPPVLIHEQGPGGAVCFCQHGVVVVNVSHHVRVLVRGAGVDVPWRFTPERKKLPAQSGCPERISASSEGGV